MANDGSKQAWGDDILPERQAELEALFQRQAEWVATPEAERGVSAFAGVHLLGADVFWLAARTLAGTNEPQAVAVQMERLRQGRHRGDRGILDLDGFHMEDANLSGAYLAGAFLVETHLEGADLVQARLEGANLGGAHLKGASLIEAHMENAGLIEVHLDGADLTEAHLEGADLTEAHLERVFLTDAHLKGGQLTDARLYGADLWGANLEGAHLGNAHLERADLSWAHLEDTDLSDAHLVRANLREAHLEGAFLSEAHLERANLTGAHLEGAQLYQSHLEGAILDKAHMEGKVYRPIDEAEHRPTLAIRRDLLPADLHGAFFDGSTTLADTILGKPGDGPGQGYVQVADVRWGGVNLAVIKDWPTEMVLGDEREAWAWQPPKRDAPKPSSKADKTPSRKERAEARRQREKDWQDKLATAAQERLGLFRAAVRANRQLAMALREQGMNEEADRFAYRAQVCQRQVFRLRHQRVRQAFSWLLDVISGHGYQPGKTLAWYLVVIFTFAGAYLAASYGILTFGLPPSSFGHLAWYEALVLSVSSFHGRGFLPFPNLGDPVTILAAIEAVFGLFIEVSFIATFTQRYFGK